MAERKSRDAFFRQSLNFCTALAAGWPPYLRPWQRASLEPRRLKSVDGVASTIWEDFWAPETHRARTWSDFARYRECRWEGTDIPQRELVAECLHRYTGDPRHTFAREKAADAR